MGSVCCQLEEPVPKTKKKSGKKRTIKDAKIFYPKKQDGKAQSSDKDYTRRACTLAIENEDGKRENLGKATIKANTNDRTLHILDPDKKKKEWVISDWEQKPIKIKKPEKPDGEWEVIVIVKKATKNVKKMIICCESKDQAQDWKDKLE